MQSFTKFCILTLAVLFSEASVIPKQNQQTLLSTINGSIGIEPFIIDGLPAKDGQFPWQVAVVGTIDDKVGFCGGALISDQWILTAAHCIPRLTIREKFCCGLRNFWKFNLKACYTPKFVIKMGGIELNASGIFVETSHSIVHPKYNENNLNNDIALIKLNAPLDLTDNIKPIQLGTTPVADKTTVVISGWGKVKDNATSISTKLNYAIVTTLADEDCRAAYFQIQLGDHIMCTDGGVTKKGTCLGDSGGPVVQQVANGEVQHVAIVSFVSSRGCEIGLPSGYTRTAPYIDWIRRTTGIE